MKKGQIAEHTYFLEDPGVTFIIRAASEMTETEKRQTAIGYMYSVPKSERPVKGDTVTIGTKVVSIQDEPEQVLIRSPKPQKE